MVGVLNMTKEDYIAIAKAINESRDSFETWGSCDTAKLASAVVAKNIADVLAQDNPHFDRARFLQACGVNE
jgi:hypothetical protein